GRLFVSSLCWIALLALIAFLPGCGTPSATKVVNFPTPANIVLNPANTSSMDVGSIQTFSAIPQNVNKRAITTPLNFQSSNTSILTTVDTGVACAGTWNSLSGP